jgi:hypothetical protein
MGAVASIPTTSHQIEITILGKSGGPLTKRIALAADGSLHSDGSACLMSSGLAGRLRFDTLDEFAEIIASLEFNEATALGALRGDLPEQVLVTTKAVVAALNGTAAPNVIARTGDSIIFRPGRQALALIDVDTKGLPAAVKVKIDAIGGFWPALVSVLPKLDIAGHVTRSSTSAGIFRADTGERLPGSNGLHVFVLVKDGADVERFLRTLHARCWLAGFGWMLVGAGGQLLDRSLIDRTVFAPQRLVFEGAPILDPPLVQDQTIRVPMVTAGPPLDTRAVCHDLSVVERAKVQDLQAAAKHRLAPDAARVRAEFIEQQALRIVTRTGSTLRMARHTVERQCSGVLLPGVVLPFDTADLEGTTVGDVLADPDRFADATLADPLEGPDYGRCKAMIMRRTDGSVWINSFAHGRSGYELKHDAASIEATLRNSERVGTVDQFVSLLLNADVAADEEQRLRELVCELSGSKIRPLAARIRTARHQQEQQRAQAKREWQAAEPRDNRVRLPAPASDGERLPVLRMLDEVLSNTGDAEPPMRDIDGYPVEVRCTEPFDLHELTADGANGDEMEKTRLPPPALPLLIRHNKYSLEHEIERYIEFVAVTKDGDERAVALQPVFVENYIAYRESTLPRVGAVVTAPLVLPTGTLLAPIGLDRERKLVFRIEPALIALLPAPRNCDAAAVASALDYLADEWLCDVATDWTGKCVLIALALTIIERVLLPARPAFFVTAGKRGGGKTTALTMLILAVTGKTPPAAAWSADEEERRKAMLAHLSAGLPALVWDNIKVGTMISCPTLEKVLTAASYSDRVLKETADRTVPAFTVMTFTGNNISPRGELASRSLGARLSVDRPDPENRRFRHSDPIAWTLDNRGAILAALYTILLGNPQLQLSQRQEEKTRFKRWWHLVGSAVEHATLALIALQSSLPSEMRTACPVDFSKLFAEAESEDEDTIGLAEALEILSARWLDTPFQAAEVAEFITDPTHAGDDVVRSFREFLGPSTRNSMAPLSPKSIGRKLAAMADAPVQVGDRVMTLSKHQPENQLKAKRTISYQVVVRGGAV